MSSTKRDIQDIMADLPEVCAVQPDENEAHVLVKRGQAGYWPLPDGLSVEEINKSVTPAQIEAMKMGSMFGFDAPGADPLSWVPQGFAHHPPADQS